MKQKKTPKLEIKGTNIALWNNLIFSKCIKISDKYQKFREQILIENIILSEEKTTSRIPSLYRVLGPPLYVKEFLNITT